MRKAILVLVFLLLVPAFALAQSAKDFWDNLKQVRAGEKLEVVNTIMKPLQGEFASSADEAISQGERKPEQSMAPGDAARASGQYEGNQTGVGNPWQVILGAKTVVVIGKKEPGWEHMKWLPSIPDEGRAKRRVEKSLRKWGRFRLVKDETQADLVLLAIEGTRFMVDKTFGVVGNNPCAQLLVFKGPGPVPKDSVPIWRREFVQGTFGVFTMKTPATVVAEQFREELEAFEKSSQAPQAPHLPVAQAAPGTPELPQAPRPPSTTEQANPTQPVPALAWTEVAAMLAGGRPSEDVTTMVKERGIAFEVCPETVWSFEVLGASGAVLQAMREARFYETDFDPVKWAELGAEAETTFRQALQTQSSNPVLHYALGNSLYGQEKMDAAMVEYREALRLKPDFAMAHRNLGIALEESGDLRVITLFGLPAAKTGNGWRAIKEFREVVRLNPESAQAHDDLGIALARTGDLNGSLAEHRKAVRLKPEFARAHLHVGLTLEELRFLDGALAEFREVVRLAPGWGEAHEALGQALGKMGDLRGALPELVEALRLNPNDADAHNALGCVLRAQADLNGAVAEYREALRLRPDFPEAESNLRLAVRNLEGARPGREDR